MYKAIGADSRGEFVFKDVSQAEIEDMAGADDNIAYLNEENYAKLKNSMKDEMRAHLESLAEAGRELLKCHCASLRTLEHFDTELVRAEDYLEKL